MPCLDVVGEQCLPSHRPVRASAFQEGHEGLVPEYRMLVEEFPMTVTGKLQKFIMGDRMIEELGLTILETA